MLILTKLPMNLLCASCKEPAEADTRDRGDGVVQVSVSCDCGRTSFYDIGDWVHNVRGEWVEIGPTVGQ